VWLQDGIPEEICARVPEVTKYGIYRKLNSGKEEYIPYCAPEIKSYINFNDKKFNEILDELLPENK
jgi:hypothetical protein